MFPLVHSLLNERLTELRLPVNHLGRLSTRASIFSLLQKGFTMGLLGLSWKNWDLVPLLQRHLPFLCPTGYSSSAGGIGAITHSSCGYQEGRCGGKAGRAGGRT